jgi:hypothetical protein
MTSLFLTANLRFEFGRWELAVSRSGSPGTLERRRDLTAGDAVAIASTLGSSHERIVRATIAAHAREEAEKAEELRAALPDRIAEETRRYETAAAAAADAARDAAEFTEED